MTRTPSAKITHGNWLRVLDATWRPDAARTAMSRGLSPGRGSRGRVVPGTVPGRACLGPVWGLSLGRFEPDAARARASSVEA